MNTEQELRPCPFCGGDASIHEFADVPDCGGCHALGPVADTVDDAIAAWNRRSSDEQAEEVVAWQWQQCKSLQPGVWPEQWNNIELRPGEDRTQYWRDLAARLPDEVRVRPLYASPPAVAAGGVTEERLEAGAKALCLATGLDWDSIPETAEGDDKDTGPETRRYFRQWFKPALTAALAVGDEGIREGWQTIDTAPTAMHVMACRFDHDVGEWVYDVVLSPPSYPFTHWRLLDPPPSRGEGE